MAKTPDTLLQRQDRRVGGVIHELRFRNFGKNRKRRLYLYC